MTGTQIAYYFVCKRKLWLSAHSIDMEQNNDNVLLGRLLSENTYKREEHEIKIDDVVLDFYDEKSNVIHEVKKSDKMEDTHIWQVKFYIFILEQKGIKGVSGELNYPKLKQKVKVELNDSDRSELLAIKTEINRICAGQNLPEVINKPFCKNCAYYDLCYI
jgi:CRISPR-associated protein Cas4